MVLWHSLRKPVSCPAVWRAQCLCEPDESLPYCKLVESAKAEEQRIWIRTFQSASIDSDNLHSLGSGQLFRLSGSHSILEVPDRVEARPHVRDLKQPTQMLPRSFHERYQALRIQIPHPPQMTCQMPIYDEVAKHRLVKG